MATPALTLSTRNLSGLAARFRAYDRRFVGAVKRSVRRNADQLLDEAWHACPVDTGYMRDHIRVLITDDGLAYEVGWREEDFLDEHGAFYPLYVIFGTVHMAGRDFFFPLARQQRAKFRRELRRSWRSSIARMGGAVA